MAPNLPSSQDLPPAVWYPGATLTVLRGGDPLLVLVDDSRWALTKADAEHIYVEAAPASLRRRLLSYLLP